MVIRELLVSLGVKTDPKGFKKANASISSLAKKAAALGAILAAGAVAVGFKKVIGLASDAFETSSAMDAIFGEARRKEIEQWSAVTAKAMGRSRFAIQDTTAQFGALLKPMLGSADQAAATAKDFSQLTIDFASFRNLTEKTAFEKLRAGLAGSSEPLLAMGIDTRIAALEQFRLAEGIKTAVKDMDTQQITSLRASLIMERLADAQGDAIKTGGGFANMTKRLEGKMRDLATATGKLLLPSVINIVSGLVDMIGVMQGLFDEHKNLIEGGVNVLARSFSVLATVVRAIFSPLGVLSTILIALGLAFKTMGAQALVAWLIAAAPVIAYIVLSGLVVAAVFLIIDSLKQMGEKGSGFINDLLTRFFELKESLGGTWAAIQEMIATAVKFYAEAIAGMFTTSKDTVTNIGKLFEDMFNDFATLTIGGLIDRFKAGFAAVFQAGKSFFGDVLASIGITTDGGKGGTARATASPSAAASSNTSNASNISTVANITVNPSPGMSERDVGAEVQAKMIAINEQDRRAAMNVFRTVPVDG